MRINLLFFLHLFLIASCYATSNDISKALIEARKLGTPLPLHLMDSIRQITIEEGKIIQKNIRDKLSISNDFGKRIGWKCGATNNAAQNTLGCRGPFYGPLYSDHIISSPQTNNIRLAKYNSFVAIEAEFCVKMGSSCPPKKDNVPYSLEEIWNSVDSIYPSIEIASTRLSGVYPVGAIIADFAWNGAVALGSPISKELISLDNIPNADVSILINNNVMSIAKGSNVLGSPILSVLWLATQLIQDGECLLESDLIMTGAACVYKSPMKGDLITARFENLVDLNPYHLLDIEILE